MPKRKKKSRADAPESSTARSKKLYSAYLAEELRIELRTWPKSDRQRVGKLIQSVQEISENPTCIPAPISTNGALRAGV